NPSAIFRLRAPPFTDASRKRPDLIAIEPAIRPPCALASSGNRSFNSFAPPRFIHDNWCSLFTKTRLPLTVRPHPHLQLPIRMVLCLGGSVTKAPARGRDFLQTTTRKSRSPFHVDVDCATVSDTAWCSPCRSVLL